jgi:hypothetical protein
VNTQIRNKKERIVKKNERMHERGRKEKKKYKVYDKVLYNKNTYNPTKRKSCNNAPRVKFRHDQGRNSSTASNLLYPR